MFDFCLENHNSLLYRKQYETLSYTNQSENKFNFKIYFHFGLINIYFLTTSFLVSFSSKKSA